MARTLLDKVQRGPQLRDRRRGRLDPHRRGPHPADHLAVAWPTPRSSTTGSPVIVRSLAARRRLRGRRGQARRRAARGGHREGRAGARHREPLRRGPAEPRAPDVTVALKAKELYKRDKDYIVQSGEVKIVDEFTGRILEGRRWSEGIHQAVEAKEGVKIKEENQTLATITLQNYFRMYDKLAGMTGTAQTEAAELMNTYGLGVVPIPTNRPTARIDQRRPDLQDRRGQVQRRRRRHRAEQHEQGPAGPRRHRQRRRRASTSARLLTQRGIPHEVLNAKQHTREAEIVTQAGRLARGHGGHQHGRSWRRHPARRQPRGLARQRGPQGGLRRRTARRRVRAPGSVRSDARGVPRGPCQGARPLPGVARRAELGSVQGRGRTSP